VFFHLRFFDPTNVIFIVFEHTYPVDALTHSLTHSLTLPFKTGRLEIGTRRLTVVRKPLEKLKIFFSVIAVFKNPTDPSCFFQLLSIIQEVFVWISSIGYLMALPVENDRFSRKLDADANDDEHENGRATYVQGTDL
jgi:hypothetical protein